MPTYVDKPPNTLVIFTVRIQNTGARAGSCRVKCALGFWTLGLFKTDYEDTSPEVAVGPGASADVEVPILPLGALPGYEADNRIEVIDAATGASAVVTRADYRVRIVEAAPAAWQVVSASIR